MAGTGWGGRTAGGEDCHLITDSKISPLRGEGVSEDERNKKQINKQVSVCVIINSLAVSTPLKRSLEAASDLMVSAIDLL